MQDIQLIIKWQTAFNMNLQDNLQKKTLIKNFDQPNTIELFQNGTPGSRAPPALAPAARDSAWSTGTVPWAERPSMSPCAQRVRAQG